MTGPVLHGERVVLRPMAAEDAPALRAHHATREVAEWWGMPEDDFPFDEPESTRFTIWVEGEVAGLIQYGEEPEPMYRHAWIDIFVGPAFHGRGVGTDAVRTLAEHLHREGGHHRITIDPAVSNHAAIKAYTRAGFRPVGVMRLAERAPLTGEWRDALFMERVVAPGGDAAG